MQDYKNTIHLPQTDFPMKGELAKREPTWLQIWEKQKLYARIQTERKNAPTFILHDGPPYANGTLHVGHAANKILKDIIIKAKVLAGMRAPFVPGWDCHGLPIELVVEKKFGKVGTKLNAAEFRAECRSYAASQIEQQRLDFKRLGILGDWDHPYTTMSPSYEAEEIRTLAKVYQNGHIKKGYKPVHWCLDCASSLAEAEVEYQDKVSDSIYVKFPSEKGNILIWTTTPWTLPANMAVAAGAEMIYIRIRVNQEIYWVAEKLFESTFPGENIEILESHAGKELEGLKLQHPFEDRMVPLILGEHVTLDAGTGFVHTAPAHGVEDFAVARQYGLAVYNPVGANGCYGPETPFFAGMHVSKANPAVIDLLTQKGNLLRHTKITHSYPHCWRHKTPLIFRATPQWFISMEHLENQALIATERISFTPPEGRNRFVSMLEGRPDWCISRQRTWGVPLPLFTHKQTGELHPETLQILEKVANAIAERGLEAWFQGNPEDFGVDSTQYDKCKDTLDVWFDSGSSSQCVLKQRPELTFPADLYLEGSDQHRAWFQASLLTALAATGEKPYHQILTHGFLVDGEGRKMSKSIGNIVTIHNAVNQYGADILRLWVALTDYTGEMAFSNTIMQQSVDVYRKIRNTMRYLLAALHEFDLSQILNLEELIQIDSFMLALADQLQTRVRAALDQYQIREAVTEIYKFCETDLSNVYFDVLKDRLYTENSSNRRSAQTALLHILHYLVRLITPILSFTADEIWQELKKLNLAQIDSPFLLEWYALPNLQKMDFSDWHQHWPILQDARAQLNKQLDEMRKNKEIGSNLDVSVRFPLQQTSWLTELAASGELKYFFIVSDFIPVFTASAPIVDKSTAPKCVRCWHHRADVQNRSDLVADASQIICDRCYHNLTEQGQKRIYF